MKKNTSKQKNNEWEIPLAAGKGVLVAFVLLMVLLLIAAILISQGHIPQEKMSGVVLAASVLASLLGAMVTVSILQKNGLIYGMVVGLLLFLWLLLIGFLFFSEFSLEHGAVELLFACLCGGAMAKLLVKKKKKILRK